MLKSSGAQKRQAFCYEQTEPLDVSVYYFGFGLLIPELFTYLLRWGVEAQKEYRKSAASAADLTSLRLYFKLCDLNFLAGINCFLDSVEDEYGSDKLFVGLGHTAGANHMLEATELVKICVCKRKALMVSCALCVDCSAVACCAVVTGYIVIRITSDKRCGILSANCENRLNIVTENLCHNLNEVLRVEEEIAPFVLHIDGSGNASAEDGIFLSLAESFHLLGILDNAERGTAAERNVVLLCKANKLKSFLGVNCNRLVDKCRFACLYVLSCICKMLSAVTNSLVILFTLQT